MNYHKQLTAMLATTDRTQAALEEAAAGVVAWRAKGDELAHGITRWMDDGQKLAAQVRNIAAEVNAHAEVILDLRETIQAMDDDGEAWKRGASDE
jgi:hypothetical protein